MTIAKQDIDAEIRRRCAALDDLSILELIELRKITPARRTNTVARKGEHMDRKVEALRRARERLGPGASIRKQMRAANICRADYEAAALVIDQK